MTIKLEPLPLPFTTDSLTDSLALICHKNRRNSFCFFKLLLIRMFRVVQVPLHTKYLYDLASIVDMFRCCHD